jgi:hypothetical protein
MKIRNHRVCKVNRPARTSFRLPSNRPCRHFPFASVLGKLGLILAEGGLVQDRGLDPTGNRLNPQTNMGSVSRDQRERSEFSCPAITMSP